MAKKQEEGGLADVLAELNKKIGNEDVVIQPLDGAEPTNVDTLPSGSVSLDLALGVAGLPKGRIIEIYGPESSGKTTLTLSFIVQALIRDPDAWCLFVDAEQAMDRDYAQKVGIDLRRCVINQPSCGEEGLDVVEKALTISRPPAVVVVDSVAALVPKSELEYELNSDKNAQPGQQAKLMSLALRKLTAIVNKSGSVVLFINQLREKVGQAAMWGNPETTPGGKALKFYASVRLDIRRIGSLTKGSGDNKEAYGNHVRVKVVKNKVAAPFKVAEFDIIFGKGVDEMTDLVQVGVEKGVVKADGKQFEFQGSTWTSAQELADLWGSDPLFQDSLRNEVRAAAFPSVDNESDAKV